MLGCSGWEVKFLHVSRGGGAPREGEMGGQKRRDFGPGKPRIDPKKPVSDPNWPEKAWVGPWLARGSMGRDFLGEGWCWCGKRFIWEERNFWAVEFLLHAGGLFHLGSFFSFPPPSRLPPRSVRGRAPPALAHPPPVVTVCAGSRLATTGGGDYSIHLISKGELALPLWNPFTASQG